MTERRSAGSGWDAPSEEKTPSQATKSTGFVSKSDKNERSHDDNEGSRGNDDRPPRGDRRGGDRSYDRAPRGDRFEDRPPRGERYGDRVAPRDERFDSYRGGDRYSDRPPRGDRFDDRPPRGDRFDSHRSDDRREERGRYEERRDYYRDDDYRRDDRYRRGDDSGKRGYGEGNYGYSRRDQGGWDSRQEEPYREKRRRTRQDEAEPNETLGIFALKYDIMQRDFDDYLASKLEKFQGNYTTKLVVDRMTGRCKGYGFITFDNIDNSKEAKDLLADGEILGQPFRVAFSVGERRPSGFQRRAEENAVTEPRDEEAN